jgi:pimeloyl-ACP methyl ester carboxylesterase
MPKAFVNGINIGYEIYGDGFPLLNLNGLGASVASYKQSPALLDALSEKFKVILFDNRGVGETDTPEIKEYTMRMLAEDAIGLLDHLGIKKAHIFGASMGGMIAQQIAVDFPEYVEKLFLQSTWPGGPKTILPEPEIYVYLTVPGHGDPATLTGVNPLHLIFSKKFLNENPELIEALQDAVFGTRDVVEGLAGQQSAIKSFDVLDRLKEVAAETFVMNAKYDIVIPPENGVLIAKTIPHARFMLMENSAHCIFEEADLMVETVLDFFTS